MHSDNKLVIVTAFVVVLGCNCQCVLGCLPGGCQRSIVIGSAVLYVALFLDQKLSLCCGFWATGVGVKFFCGSSCLCSIVLEQQLSVSSCLVAAAICVMLS